MLFFELSGVQLEGARKLFSELSEETKKALRAEAEEVSRLAKQSGGVVFPPSFSWDKYETGEDLAAALFSTMREVKALLEVGS